MGHFRREIPSGYLHFRETGSYAQMDPDLTEYYRPLRRIIADPLWSWARLRTIVEFNLGYHDQRLERYLEDRAARPPDDP